MSLRVINNLKENSINNDNVTYLYETCFSVGNTYSTYIIHRNIIIVNPTIPLLCI